MKGLLKYTVFGSVVFICLISVPLYSQGKVSACGHHDYPPWNWEKDGNIVGVCAEVTEKLFAKLGVKVDLSYIGPWKRCQKNIEVGRIDINICSFMNPTRQSYSRFIATPMGYNENAIFVKKGKEFPYSKWSDLKGKVGVMMRGVSIGKRFDRYLNENIIIQRVNNNRQVFGLLELERVDFAPYGRYSGLALLESQSKTQDFTILETPVVKGKLYISMSNKSKYLHLLPQIEAFMQQPTYERWISELQEKYITVYANEFVSFPTKKAKKKANY
jgi:polar amino acid transport system substrate-binding protein